MRKIFLEEIIDRYKYPQHRKCGIGQKLCAQNVSCGDKISLYVNVKNGIIKSASFEGSLCSIANYGAELLIDEIVGRKICDIKNITSRNLLDESSDEILQNPVRLKCFEIAQIALIKLQK